VKNAFILATVALVITLFGCEKSQDKPAAKESAKPEVATKPKDDQKPGDGHDHGHHDDHAHQDGGDPSDHGDEVVELGSAKLGEFNVRAARDKAELKPGGDAPIDVWIDGGVGKEVTAVRLWIGTQDAKGSIRAKADIENGKWHTHVEIPSPIPTGGRLWVELEESGGKKTVGSFDLSP